jgi:hypothetical protein
MALFPCKTEMKGTTSRLRCRAEVKISARKHRRVNDTLAVRDQLNVSSDFRRSTAGTKGKSRQWCRGKRGVPHQLVVRDYVTVKRVTWPTWFRGGGVSKILLCAACGKEFDSHHPREGRRIPDWVMHPPVEP